MISHGPTHLPLPEDLILILRPIKLHRLNQLHLRELLRERSPHRTRPHDANVPIDLPLMAYQARSLIGRQASPRVESARVPVDVVIPPVGAYVVVKLADFDGSIPAQVLAQLALFRDLVAKPGKMEGLDLAGDVVEDGRVRGSRRGTEDVAVGLSGVGRARCLTRRFVDGPVGLLTVLTAVVGNPASAAFASAWLRTSGIGADLGHD